MVVSGFLSGDPYIEPEGPGTTLNLTTGETCLMDFKSRGTFFTKKENVNFLTAEVKSKDGEPLYKFEGKYTTQIALTNLRTGETEEAYRAPKLLPTEQDRKTIYGLTTFALQLNNLSDELRA